MNPRALVLAVIAALAGCAHQAPKPAKLEELTPTPVYNMPAPQPMPAPGVGQVCCCVGSPTGLTCGCADAGELPQQQ